MKNFRVGGFALALLITMGAVGYSADPVTEGNPFEIKSVQRGVKAVAYVDNGWKDNVPCLVVELRTTRELGEGKVYARAYFFDKEGKQVQKYGEPPQVSDDHRTYSSIPSVFKPKQPQKVAFPLSEKATQTKDKWTRAVLVFGNKDFATAETYPKDDVSKFEFPEKALVLKSQAPPK